MITQMIPAPDWFALIVDAYHPEVVKLEPLMGWCLQDDNTIVGYIADGYLGPTKARTETGFREYVSRHTLTNPLARHALIEDLREELESKYSEPIVWGMIEGGLRV